MPTNRVYQILEECTDFVEDLAKQYRKEFQLKDVFNVEKDLLVPLKIKVSVTNENGENYIFDFKNNIQAWVRKYEGPYYETEICYDWYWYQCTYDLRQRLLMILFEMICRGFRNHNDNTHSKEWLNINKFIVKHNYEGDPNYHLYYTSALYFAYNMIIPDIRTNLEKYIDKDGLADISDMAKHYHISRDQLITYLDWIGIIDYRYCNLSPISFEPRLL